jgi:hypothetical protein
MLSLTSLVNVPTYLPHKSELKKSVLGMLEKKALKKIPDTAMMEAILKRDFTHLDPKEGDDAGVVAKKKKSLEEHLAVLDLYTEHFVSCVAGSKLWNPTFHHSKPMSTSTLPNSTKLRVTPSTEALTAVLMLNARSKWHAMHKWKAENKNTRNKMPRYSAKYPDQNTAFKTLYSDPAAGQNKFGGWNDQGRFEFHRLQMMVIEARKDGTRCLDVDTAVADRLRHANQGLYENTKTSKKRKAAAMELNVEEQVRAYAHIEEE